MAIASTNTVMPLDQYAEIMGTDPVLFNQLYSTAEGIPPSTQDCQAVWFQYDWQDPNHASREELAQAINHAEHLIAQLIGFWPGPKWIEEENKIFPAYGRSYDVYSNLATAGLWFPARRPDRWKTARLNWSKFIAGGRRRVELIEEDVATNILTATQRVTLTTTYTGSGDIQPNEVAVFFDDDTRNERRVRNLNVQIESDGSITVVGWAGQFVDPDLLDSREEIDGDVLANFVDAVNIYRVWTSNYGEEYAPIEFQWQSTECSSSAYTYGVLNDWDPDHGIVVPRPATWDEDDEAWTERYFSTKNEPDRMLLWYQSGLPLDDYGRVQAPFAEAIAALATSLLVKPVCGCTQDERKAAWWQTTPEERSVVSYAQLNCPWGSKNGAWEAYRMLRHHFTEVGGINTARAS
jgi:hypothetical protein